MIPNLKSKELENICIYRMECEEAAGRATMSRYGVQAVYAGAGWDRTNIDCASIAETMNIRADQVKTIIENFSRPASIHPWQPIKSLPDFEGALPGGRQFIFETKVCSQASFPLDESKFAERQLKHLLKRSRFDVITFILIHFNKRELKTKSSTARTIAFPVRHDHPFWQAFSRAEVKRISEQDCEQYGINVEWNVYPGRKKESPDIYSAILKLGNIETVESLKTLNKQTEQLAF